MINNQEKHTIVGVLIGLAGVALVYFLMMLIAYVLTGCETMQVNVVHIPQITTKFTESK